jgi:hypothetical protein
MDQRFFDERRKLAGRRRVVRGVVDVAEGCAMRRLVAFVEIVLLSVFLAWPASLPAQTCGDGVVDDGETCDPPGSAAPVGPGVCRADCTFCGDGVVDVSEACDIGATGMCAPCGSDCVYRIVDGEGDGGCPCAFDDPDLVDLRADILAACQCSTASSHGAFVRCARAQLALLAGESTFPGCRKSALKCLARSVCGKPGAVTCCRTDVRGAQKCVVKSDAGHCTAPKGGSATLGVSENCCDACP